MLIKFFLFMLLDNCLFFVHCNERIIYKNSTNCSKALSMRHQSRQIHLCFEISYLDFDKGYSIKSTNINIKDIGLLHPVLTKNSFHLVTHNATDNASGRFEKIEVNFVREEHKSLSLVRNISHSCFTETQCTIDVSFLVSKHSDFEFVRCHINGILYIQLHEAGCDFEKTCAVLTDESVKKLKQNANTCTVYCNVLPTPTETITGSYGYILPSEQTTRLTSKYIFRSGYRCLFQYTVWTRPKVSVNISIHTPTTWSLLDVKEFASYTKEWKNVNVSIGKIDEPFYITVDVQSKYYAAFGNFEFTNCDLDTKPECEKADNLMCSTGKCIPRSHVCDLYPDCLYSDDETSMLCGNSTDFTRCDFEISDCGWKLYNQDSGCRWSLAKNENDGGRSWYLSKSSCLQDSAAEILLPLVNKENVTRTTCKMRLMYQIQGEASVFIDLSTSTVRKTIHTLKNGDGNAAWRRDFVLIPFIEDRFKLYIVGQFNEDGKESRDFIKIDNVSFESDCFEYDVNNWTTTDIKPYKSDKSEQQNHDDNILWQLCTAFGTLVTCVLFVIGLSVYKRKAGQTTPSAYRKISTNSTTSSVLLGMQKHDSKDNWWGTELIKPFLGGSGMSNVSPLYDWSQVNDNVNIIPRNKITIQRMLGKGAFGEVYYGLLADVPRQQTPLPVAVKMLPPLCSDQSKSEFFLEAISLSKLRHPNIVKCLGISVDDKPMYLVLELMSGGDLRSFVRECRVNDEMPAKVTKNELLQLCIDVAKGCEYLEVNKFIHRDIAARNCLLSSKGPGKIAKIADFGMTKNVFRTNYYRKNGMAMVPVKWMPPEAYLDGVFTIKTDVWGFGVVLWEVFTLGRVPYPGKSNNEVMDFVAKGGRLDKPDICSNEIYQLMCKCWETKPLSRPDFKSIIEELAQIQKASLLSEENELYAEIESANTETDVLSTSQHLPTDQCD